MRGALIPGLFDTPGFNARSGALLCQWTLIPIPDDTLQPRSSLMSATLESKFRGMA